MASPYDEDDIYDRAEDETPSPPPTPPTPPQTTPPDSPGADSAAFNVNHLASFKYVPSPENEDENEYINYGMDRLLEIDRKKNVLPLSCSLFVDKTELRIKSRNESLSLDKEGNSDLRIPLDSIVTAEVQRSFSHSGSFKYPNLIFFLTTPSLNSVEDEIHIFQGIDCLSSDILDQYNRRKKEAGETRRKLSLKLRESNAPPPRMDPMDDPTYATAYAHMGDPAASAAAAAATEAAAAARPLKKKETFNVVKPVVAAPVASKAPSYPDDDIYDDPERDDDKEDGVNNEQTIADMKQMDAAFAHIESFHGRLRGCAAAQKERQKLEAEKKISKPKTSDQQKKLRAKERELEGRSSLPSEDEFVENFKSFKKAFNLIGKYDWRLQDPTAPELVRQLFVPLKYSVDASKGPKNNSASVASSVVLPVLSDDAKRILNDSLQAKDKKFWNSLGEAWNLSEQEVGVKEEQRLSIGSVNSRDDNNNNNNNNNGTKSKYLITESDYASVYRPKEEEKKREAQLKNGQPGGRTSLDSTDGKINGDIEDIYDQADDQVQYLEDNGDDTDKKLASLSFYEIRNTKKLHKTFNEKMKKFESQLKTEKCQVGEAQFDRVGKRVQELTVRKTEVVEIVNDSKNWWFVRNWRGEDGYIPSTIVSKKNS